MPIITNIHNLPDPFVDLVTFDAYSKGRSDFTTTEIIGPPRAAILRRRHDHEIEEDASMRAWAMSGSAKHYILQKIAELHPERYIAEKRLYLNVHGKILGGQLDLYDKKTSTLYDYKETKVYKVTKADKFDWEAQANINRYLVTHIEGLEVKEIRYIAFLKDWKMSDRERDGSPDTPIVAVPLRMWSDEETLAYIEKRVRLHMNFASLPDNDIPVCSKDERWQGDTVFAVRHPDNDKATKKFPNEEFPEQKEAKMRAEQLAFELNNKPKAKKTGYVVEERESVPTRCIDFCGANKFCDWFQNYQKKHAE